MIFRELEELDIPYIVCLATIQVTEAIDMHSYDYFITIKTNDFKRLNYVDRKGFRATHSNRIDTFERNLLGSEIRYFNRNKSKFTKVVHNNYGKIYELNNKPFKK